MPQGIAYEVRTKSFKLEKNCGLKVSMHENEISVHENKIVIHENEHFAQIFSWVKK